MDLKKPGWVYLVSETSDVVVCALYSSNHVPTQLLEYMYYM